MDTITTRILENGNLEITIPIALRSLRGRKRVIAPGSVTVHAPTWNPAACSLRTTSGVTHLAFGTIVSNPSPGDICWTPGHVAIYIGNGQFIHAPHSGAVVSTQSIAGTYGMRLVAARRIF